MGNTKVMRRNSADGVSPESWLSFMQVAGGVHEPYFLICNWMVTGGCKNSLNFFTTNLVNLCFLANIHLELGSFRVRVRKNWNFCLE